MLKLCKKLKHNISSINTADVIKINITIWFRILIYLPTFIYFFQNVRSANSICPTTLLGSSFKISCYQRELLLYHFFLFFALHVRLILGSFFPVLSFCLFARLSLSFSYSLFLFQLVTVDARRSSMSSCFPLSSSFLQSRCCALFFVLSGERKMQEESERDLFWYLLFYTVSQFCCTHSFSHTRKNHYSFLGIIK